MEGRRDALHKHFQEVSKSRLTPPGKVVVPVCDNIQRLIDGAWAGSRISRPAELLKCFLVAFVFTLRAYF